MKWGEVYGIPFLLWLYVSQSKKKKKVVLFIYLRPEAVSPWSCALEIQSESLKPDYLFVYFVHRVITRG